MTIKRQKKLSFFDGLSKEEQQILLSNGTEIFVQKGNALFLEGDRPNHVYLIKHGKVRLSKSTIDGRVLYIEMKETNDLVGEVGLYNNLTVSFNAEVIHDSFLIRYERATLEQICSENNTIALAFLKWFSQHNSVILAQFRDLIFCGKKGAVLSILIRLCNSHGKKMENGILINKKLTNQELANYVGITRESISRILKNLIKEKIISINNKYITIHNIDYLHDELRCEDCSFTECKL